VSAGRHSTWLFPASLLVSLLLALMPVPGALAMLKPYWPALVMLYWILEAPERMGLGTAFLFGLAADLVFGTLFGEQAVRLAILAFLALRFRARIRFFPLWQQALAVLVLLLNDRAVVLAIRVFTGEGWPAPGFWLAPAAGMLLWPLVFLLLDGLSQRLRGRR
jgi:rod shape-determining protein MreD